MSQPHTTYLLKGRLGAIVCDDARLPLAHVGVRVYRAQGEDPGMDSVGKDAPGLLSEEAIQAKSARLLCEAQTDGEGTFQVELSHEGYRGQALEFDVCIVKAQSQGCGPADCSRQLALCVAQPAWRQGPSAWEALWGHNLARYAWCRALGLCQSQTLCGRVVDCHGKLPLPGVRVAVFGLDWNQDHALGQAVTDAHGRFLIHTKHPGFRRAKGGGGSRSDSYDLYFRIQSQASAFPLYVDSIRWGDRLAPDASTHCLNVSILVETDLARLREEGRVASFLALTGSQSVLGLKNTRST